MHYMVTANGHGFFEASSAFQKAIRRCDEKMALYFMVDFFNAGYDEYLWKRMKIICSEDIGLAEPNIASNIQALYQMYSDQKKDSIASKKDGKPERMFLTHAVTMMARARKSRLVDYNVMVSWRSHDPIDIPDYAYDKHTQKGKAMGRGVDHFFTEGAHLENWARLPGEEAQKAEALRLIKLKPGKLSFTKPAKGNKQNTIFDEDDE